MRKTYRRISTEFKLLLVEAFLAGEGSIKGLATQAGINHSLLHYWLGKYRDGALSLDVRREEELVEAEQQIAGLERKVRQLTMELDLLKKGSSGKIGESGDSGVIQRHAIGTGGVRWRMRRSPRCWEGGRDSS